MKNKQAPYKKLKTYQQSVVIYDLTVEFCGKFLGKGNFKLKEQMTGAARSGKQNIAEGQSQGTSLKSYIKLLGVALGSLKELYEDYEDFARQKEVTVWKRTAKSKAWVRKALVEHLEGYKRGKGYKATLPVNEGKLEDPTWCVNYLLNIINMTTYLLQKQIDSLEEKFAKEGGYTENLFKKRIKNRNRN